MFQRPLNRLSHPLTGCQAQRQSYLVAKAHNTVGCGLKEHGAAEWHAMEAAEEEYDQISQRTREWGERREEDFTNHLP